jgi:2-amino-4-hydroxy-6-hydroxymethyldihydropteridine diphosphokinase
MALFLNTLAATDVFAGNLLRETGHYCVHKFAYLSLGSNLGDRAANLKSAIDRLHEFGEVAAVSSFYETDPVEVLAQPWFLNCVVKLQTENTPGELLAGILAIEHEMGRERKQKKGPRIIDIDILLFGSSIIKSQGLTVPHPAMHERRFVLEPLAEIAGELQHPLLKRTILELWETLPKGQVVKKLLAPKASSQFTGFR